MKAVFEAEADKPSSRANSEGALVLVFIIQGRPRLDIRLFQM